MLEGWGPLIKDHVFLLFLRLYYVDVVLLQELKLCQPSPFLLRSHCAPRINEWISLDSDGASGGQLLGWNGALFECTSQLVGTFLLSVKLKHRASVNSYSFTSVYGPCVPQHHAAF